MTAKVEVEHGNILFQPTLRQERLTGTGFSAMPLKLPTILSASFDGEITRTMAPEWPAICSYTSSPDCTPLPVQKDRTGFMQLEAYGTIRMGAMCRTS